MTFRGSFEICPKCGGELLRCNHQSIGAEQLKEKMKMLTEIDLAAYLASIMPRLDHVSIFQNDDGTYWASVTRKDSDETWDSGSCPTIIEAVQNAVGLLGGG